MVQHNTYSYQAAVVSNQQFISFLYRQTDTQTDTQVDRHRWDQYLFDTMADIQVINCEFDVYCDSCEFSMNTTATYTVQYELFKQVSKEFTHST